MTSNQYPEAFDDSPMIIVDGEPEPGGPSTLELLERGLEKRLARESDENHTTILRETLERLKARTNPPEQNVRDYYRIVHYLLYDRVDPDPQETSS